MRKGVRREKKQAPVRSYTPPVDAYPLATSAGFPGVERQGREVKEIMKAWMLKCSAAALLVGSVGCKNGAPSMDFWRLGKADKESNAELAEATGVESLAPSFGATKPSEKAAAGANAYAAVPSGSQPPADPNATFGGSFDPAAFPGRTANTAADLTNPYAQAVAGSNAVTPFTGNSAGVQTGAYPSSYPGSTSGGGDSGVYAASTFTPSGSSGSYGYSAPAASEGAQAVNNPYVNSTAPAADAATAYVASNTSGGYHSDGLATGSYTGANYGAPAASAGAGNAAPTGQYDAATAGYYGAPQAAAYEQSQPASYDDAAYVGGGAPGQTGYDPGGYTEPSGSGYTPGATGYTPPPSPTYGDQASVGQPVQRVDQPYRPGSTSQTATAPAATSWPTAAYPAPQEGAPATSGSVYR